MFKKILGGEYMSIVYEVRKREDMYEKIQESIREYSTGCCYRNLGEKNDLIDTILIRFLNVFHEDDFAFDKNNPLRTKIPDIYTLIVINLFDDIETYKKQLNSNEELKEKILKIDSKLYEEIEKSIFEYVEDSYILTWKITKYSEYIEINNIMKGTKEIIQEVYGIIGILILEADFIKKAILLYLYPNKNADSSFADFFDNLFRAGKRPLEVAKLKLIFKFCKEFYTKDNPYFADTAIVLAFIAKYLNFNIESARTTDAMVNIRYWTAVLLKKEPSYFSNFETLVEEEIYWLNAQVEEPYPQYMGTSIARQKVKDEKRKAARRYEWEKNNIGIKNRPELWRYQEIFNSYNSEKSDLDLDYEQKRALRELGRLFGNNGSVNGLFGDIEQMKNEASLSNVYLVNDFALLCAISLYYHALYQVPIRRCSLCNRYYIPKQNRKKEENYCHRIYPRQKMTGKNLTCSEYNSHILSAKGKSEDEILNRLVKQINNLRSSLCQGINKREHIRESVETVNFFQKILTVIKAEAKKNSPLSDNNVSVKAGDAVKRLYDKLSKLDKAGMPEIERKIKEDNIFDSEAEVTSEEVFYYVTELESLVEKKILSKNKKNKESDLYR